MHLLTGSLFKLDLESGWVVAVAAIVFFKLVGGQSLYLLFFVFLGFCYIGLLFLWKGFTFNFLILFILYSTVFIIFWIFLIAFGDLQLKRELSRRQYTPLLLVFVAPAIYSPWTAGVPGVGAAIAPTNSPQWDSSSIGELSVLYSYLYGFHLDLVFLLFCSLLIGCISVVTVLLLRSSWKITDSAGFLGRNNQNGAGGFRRVFFSNPVSSGPSLSSIRG